MIYWSVILRKSCLPSIYFTSLDLAADMARLPESTVGSSVASRDCPFSRERRDTDLELVPTCYSSAGSLNAPPSFRISSKWSERTFSSKRFSCSS